MRLDLARIGETSKNQSAIRRVGATRRKKDTKQ